MTIDNFRYDIKPDGYLDLYGDALYYDSLRGSPKRHFGSVRRWLHGVLPLQASAKCNGIRHDHIQYRPDQPSSDPRQRATMNCGIFVMKTIEAKYGLLPLEDVSEQFMRHHRDSSASRVLLHAASSLTSHGMPLPVICMAACLGAACVDPTPEKSDCVPTALLTVIAAHRPHNSWASLPRMHRAIHEWLAKARTPADLFEGLSRNHACPTSTSAALQAARAEIAKVHGDSAISGDRMPVPILALHKSLQGLGARAILLLAKPDVVELEAVYYMGSKDVRDADVTTVLLYSASGKHVVSLVWPLAGRALEFAKLAMESFGSSPFSILEPVHACAESASWIACGDVGELQFT